MGKYNYTIGMEWKDYGLVTPREEYKELQKFASLSDLGTFLYKKRGGMKRGNHFGLRVSTKEFNKYGDVAKRPLGDNVAYTFIRKYSDVDLIDKSDFKLVIKRIKRVNLQTKEDGFSTGSLRVHLYILDALPSEAWKFVMRMHDHIVEVNRLLTSVGYREANEVKQSKCKDHLINAAERWFYKQGSNHIFSTLSYGPEWEIRLNSDFYQTGDITWERKEGTRQLVSINITKW